MYTCRFRCSHRSPSAGVGAPIYSTQPAVLLLHDDDVRPPLQDRTRPGHGPASHSTLLLWDADIAPYSGLRLRVIPAIGIHAAYGLGAIPYGSDSAWIRFELWDSPALSWGGGNKPTPRTLKHAST